ncbi:dCTP deaminase [bacterium]|jgi:dCTP deaminase|nr:dCTP deaminase [bacterium]
MILSDTTIISLVKSKTIEISPFDESAVQPASVDFRLGREFLKIDETKQSSLSLDKEPVYRKIESDSIIIQPNTFMLATTLEFVGVPNGITAFVEGRSSIGRMGLFIQNAGWVDSGFEGRITLELYNANHIPIELKAGRRICQIVFCKMDNTASNPYRGKYFRQDTTQGSRIHKDIEIDKNIETNVTSS